MSDVFRLLPENALRILSPAGPASRACCPRASTPVTSSSRRSSTGTRSIPQSQGSAHETIRSLFGRHQGADSVHHLLDASRHLCRCIVCRYASRNPGLLSNVGDHLREKRPDLGLLQREVSLLLGSTECSVHLWETNRTAPALPFLPAIVVLLGYRPLNPDDSSGLRLVRARRCSGLSQPARAGCVDIDPGTLCRIERGLSRVRSRFLERIREYLKTRADERARSTPPSFPAL